MAVMNAFVPYYSEIFQLPDFFAAPVLCFGYQDMENGVTINGTQYRSLQDAIEADGMEAHSVDLFDERADLRYDMNNPVPAFEHERYGTLIDIGSIEHLFDTRQCLENCMRMLRVGGHYLLHAPISGYFGHGLHTFHPEGLMAALEINGFRILYCSYHNIKGKPMENPCRRLENLESGEILWEDPTVREDIMICLAAVKERSFQTFTNPQQGKWKRIYGGSTAN
jgi:hypothetical protein